MPELNIVDDAILDKFAEKLITSTKRMQYIEGLPNNELAEALLLLVWSDLEMFSLQSDLVEEAIERLKDDDN